MKRIITALALCALSAVSARSAGAEQEPVRINYPRIFGVRPGSPFLFRVPVSGSRPFTVIAKGMPGGLSLDPATGIVRGTIADLEKKTHPVTLTAQNALGSSTQMIRRIFINRILTYRAGRKSRFPQTGRCMGTALPFIAIMGIR